MEKERRRDKGSQDKREIREKEKGIGDRTNNDSEERKLKSTEDRAKHKREKQE